MPGDVVQLANSEGDYYHTLLVTGKTPEGLLVSAHSNDTYNRPLSAYTAPIKRFLHIRGVAFEVREAQQDCYEALLEGRALPARP